VITTILVGGEADRQAPLDQKNDYSVAVTTSVDAQSSGASDESTQITASYIGQSLLFDRYEPMLTSGVSEDGLFYVSGGVSTAFRLANFELRPHFGPVFYQSRLSGPFELEEALQFKTGYDISYRFTERLSLTAGYHHLSNAQITTESADLNVTHLGLQLHF
jgi:hypothetical protein